MIAREGERGGKGTTGESEAGERGLLVQPLVEEITLSFRRLQSSLPFEQVELEGLLVACGRVGDMVALFGASMLPVKANITDNIKKIRSHTDDHAAETSTLREFIESEVERGIQKEEGGVCLSALWLKRAMDFLVVFMNQFAVCGSSSSNAASAAFSASLEPFQGWMLRTTCKAAMKMVPSDKKLLRSLCVEEDGQEREVDGEKVKAALKELLEAVRPVVEEMDEWFEKKGLNFPDKV